MTLKTKLGKFHLITTPGPVDFDGERGLRNSGPSIIFLASRSRDPYQTGLNISPISRLRGIVLAPNHVNQRVVLHLDIIGSWDIA